MKNKILIIEDDTVFQKVLSQALEDAGFETVTASDGEAGVRLADKEEPQLIVLDVILPKKDGFTVMEYLSKSPKLSSVPVMVITNLEGSHDVERMMTLGAKGFLIKVNYSMEEIVAAIKNIMDTYAVKKKK
ncbi:MAG: response regulator [Candidatus Niyogibacteria bacterium CG10_big_fil_rev_8_21_14_0_10_46_36]|uniref:Response regulator n=1 Tax=Candidatus Niyogibacteria bacterium CG10_big_fil_rev_8_21_14_0_10_46_36 TaxID=1974726 RepID=A0A2H0TCJ9_9BACT|nr:MAG: response regulator [Candidatus Niyogibacteria bacterium CG10_big_fil_rev_8_21_14_0_10_46_36]